MAAFLKHRSLSAAAAVLLLAALYSQVCSAQAASEPIASDATAEAAPEVIHLRFERGFSLTGPPGCAATVESGLICRSDKKPVQRFETNIVSKTGLNPHVESASLEGSCVTMKVLLAVDHSGPGGRICLAPVSRLFVDVTLH
ncbi:hypothetical protein [Burkholderia cenocepacia]|uniref:hypothetical protein n=1 Tax=Burkholderia cenocepacia TaxID=95486 RepID=UPI00123761E6|nr:hypothetical protein [Burkholderia cenocepacia]